MSLGNARIARIEAARRQLDAAIKMWLENYDPLAIHTLAMASYGLLKDLTAAKDVRFHREIDRQIKETIGHSAFRLIANQLKHADKDIDADVTVPDDQFNEKLIGGSLVFYRVIMDDVSEAMGAFHLMMLSAHSERFKVAEDFDPDIEAGAKLAGSMLRNDIALRRKLVEINLKLMNDGSIPRNISLLRNYQKFNS